MTGEEDKTKHVCVLVSDVCSVACQPVIIFRTEVSHNTLPQVHLMYQRLPASLMLQARPEPHHLDIQVFPMVEARSEIAMADLVTGLYLVCAQVRLGNTELQSDCAQARVASSTPDNTSTTSTSYTNTMGLPIVMAITVAGLAFLAVVSYSVYSLVVRNRRMSRER